MLIFNDDITGELQRISQELEKLGKMKITIGIQGVAGKNMKGQEVSATADIMTIAGIHEFGATIKAKNVRNLAIPIAKKAVGKSPLDFKDLFFIRSKNGYLFGCISKKEKGTNPRVASKPSDKKPKKKKSGKRSDTKKGNDDIEYLFILFESVDIPERSFIRAGFDSSKEKIDEAIRKVYRKIMFEGWDAETAANHVGMVARNCIVRYMMDSTNFRAKGSIVRSTTNWPDKPLMETARLRNSITFVVGKG